MKALTKAVVNWTKSEFDKLHMTDAVLGISGGADSSVVAAIAVAALGKEHVHGILLPNGIQADIKDSYQLVNHLGISYDVQDISTLVRESLALVPGAADSYDAKVNIGARIRTNQIMVNAQTNNWLMLNTCNLSEDTVGYSTLWGDSCGSLAPISHLTKDEVIMIGEDLCLPENLIKKTPFDGLQPLSDEEKLGFTYREVNELIRKGIKGPNCEKIMKMYHKNKFKTDIIRIPFFDPKLPNFIIGEYI